MSFLDSVRIFTNDRLYLLDSPDLMFDYGKHEDVNCPICLETVRSPFKEQKQLNPVNEKLRGGEDDFKVTLLCEHTFHWMCIANWNETTCPLCRYHACPQETSECQENGC